MTKKIDFCYGIIFCISLTALIISCLAYTKSLPTGPKIPETLENGDACVYDTQCDSGYCHGTTVIAGEPVEGQCAPKPVKRNWPQTCTHNSQCDTWCSGRAGTSKDYCCPTGGTSYGHLYAFKHYCDNLPSGTDCKSDAMCKSNDCKGNKSGFATGKCK